MDEDEEDFQREVQNPFFQKLLGMD